jgi:hypothetical protein
MSPSYEYLLFNGCEVSRSMDKCVAANAVRLSHGSEGTKRPLNRLLLLFNNHNREHPKSKHSGISRLVVRNEACCTQ